MKRRMKARSGEEQFSNQWSAYLRSKGEETVRNLIPEMMELKKMQLKTLHETQEESVIIHETLSPYISNLEELVTGINEVSGLNDNLPYAEKALEDALSNITNVLRTAKLFAESDTDRIAEYEDAIDWLENDADNWIDGQLGL